MFRKKYIYGNRISDKVMEPDSKRMLKNLFDLLYELYLHNEYYEQI